MNEKLLLTPEEVGDRLGVKRTTIYGLIKDGELKTVRIGRSRRIPVAELNNYVARLLQT